MDTDVYNVYDGFMARPKEFKREEALCKAMEVFWTQGFEATTMTQLRHAMGLGRQSLYDTFGDKKKLFDEALSMYINLNDTNAASLLKSDDGLEAIRFLLNARVQMLSADETRRGCLMVNTAIELAHRDKDAAEKLQSSFGYIKKLFAHALERAEAAGQLRENSNIEELAITLVTQFSGMVILAKTGASMSDLQAVADQAYRALI